MVGGPKWRSRRGAEIAVATIGALGVVVAAVVTGAFGLIGSGAPPPAPQPQVRSGGSSNQNSCVAGSVVNGGTINCSATSARSTGQQPTVKAPVATTADAGCGTPRDHHGLSVRLRVVMWCAPFAVRGQYEFKLKVAVTNTGRKPLDVEASHFFLLWKTLNSRKWSPPPGSRPAAPRRVKYAGREYWAISANPDGVAEPITSIDWTFATHWSHTTLAPGATSMRLGADSRALRVIDPNGAVKTIRFNPNQDDLVFYVPRSAVEEPRNFVGLAYWDGQQVIALCPQTHWGPKIPPGYWTGK